MIHMAASGTVTIFACPYCGRTSEKQVCACRNTLYERAGFSASGFYVNYSQQVEQKKKCTAKLSAQQAERAAKTAAKAAAFIDKESGKAQKSDARYDAEAINGSREAVIAYLRALVCAEGNIYSLGRVYAEVCKRLDNALVMQEYNAHILKELLNSRSESGSKPESPEETEARIQKLTESQLKADGIECPVKPVEPILAAKKVKAQRLPSEPVYEKPGLLNRKRVEAQNEEKKRTFEQAMASYRRSVQLAERYEEEKKRYDAQTQAYRAELAAYRDALAVYDEKRAAAEEAIRERVIREKAEQETALKQEKKNSEKELAQTCADAVKSFPHQKRVDYLQERKKELEKALSEAVGQRRALYAAGVIYQKYQTLVAEASMLEYLEARRCETLTGDNGAYNLYESEIHAGIINPLLEQLLLSVETVKTSKTVLFKELSRISKTVKDGTDKLEKASAALTIKTSNAVLARQWLAEKGIKETPLEEPAQAKLDAFSAFLGKQIAKDAETLFQLEQAITSA